MSHTKHSSLGNLLVGLSAALLVLAVGRAAMQGPPEVATQALPDPVELDSLRPYLSPAGELPPWLGDSPYAPSPPPRAGGGPDPWSGSAPVTPRGRVELAPRAYSLTAILVQPGDRMAVIDNRQVRPGDRLPGRARVTRIEADHVIVQDPDGSRRVLWLRNDGEGE